MSMDGATVLQWCAAGGEALIGLALLAAAIRLALGPTALDRVLALDLIAVLAAGAIVVHGIATREPVWMEAAFALVLVGFLGTIFFAGFLERAGAPSDGIDREAGERVGRSDG